MPIGAWHRGGVVICIVVRAVLTRARGLSILLISVFASFAHLGRLGDGSTLAERLSPELSAELQFWPATHLHLPSMTQMTKHAVLIMH